MIDHLLATEAFFCRYLLVFVFFFLLKGKWFGIKPNKKSYNMICAHTSRNKVSIDCGWSLISYWVFFLSLFTCICFLLKGKWFGIKPNKKSYKVACTVSRNWTLHHIISDWSVQGRTEHYITSYQIEVCKAGTEHYIIPNWREIKDEHGFWSVVSIAERLNMWHVFNFELKSCIQPIQWPHIHVKISIFTCFCEGKLKIRSICAPKIERKIVKN